MRISDWSSDVCSSDLVVGGNGDDVLRGGVGNDALNGGSGNDIYVFSQGFGQDTIENFDDAAGRVDKIVFESGIAPADMLVRRQGNDLLLSSADGDSVRVVGHFNDDGVGRFSITNMQFADGPVWPDRKSDA